MKRRGFTRETTIRRDARGKWYQDGVALAHDGLSRSFDAWIERAPDGRFCLDNAINWAFVEIEGPPYSVRSASIADDRVTLQLSGDGVEELDPTTLRLGEDDALWCDVRGGRVPARFDNHAALALSEAFELEGDEARLVLGASRFAIPRVADPMAGWTPAKGHVESRG